MNTFGHRDTISLTSKDSPPKSPKTPKTPRKTQRRMSPRPLESELRPTSQESNEFDRMVAQYDAAMAACRETLRSTTDEYLRRKTKANIAKILKKQVLLMLNGAYESLASKKYKKAFRQFELVKNKCQLMVAESTKLFGFKKEEDLEKKLQHLERALESTWKSFEPETDLPK